MEIKLLDSRTIAFHFQYDQKTVALVKKLPSARFNIYGRFWLMDRSLFTPQMLEILEAHGFKAHTGIIPSLEQSAPVLEPLNALNLPLYPYQREIVEFMVKTGSCLNASFVGSGKTLTSLAVCMALEAKRILIIAPKSVVLQWSESQIPKWLGIKGNAIVAGNRKYTNLDGFNVIGYDTARLDIDLLSLVDFDIIICDEAHRLANPRTKLYKALFKLKSKFRFALTATPVMNQAQDIFSIINWLRPGVLGNYWSFLNRYIVKGGYLNKQILGNKNMDELALRIKPYIIKRTLEEVGMQLPAYTEEEIPIELNPTERKNYDLIKSELLLDIEPMVINKIENPVMLQMSIVKMGKLFELCDTLELIGESSDSSKLDALKEHLEGTLVNGNKAIIITRFSRMAEILRRELREFGPEIITGATQNRQDIIGRFESSPAIRLLIGTEAIGQGLNLQVANILYNYDSAWNPARMEQRAGRIYRNGQDKPVFIYNLVVQKSVEKWLQKKLIKKAELSARLLPKSFAEIKEMLYG